ncbi:DUF2913 family protein [Vibrio fluvialis]|uniref:DUF2913 family protein n=1 Tax=Vibrio fluvialis TaxID=676 RepID=UPI001EE9EA12|nr:DUF2913 family protein [Vibrio fluvialis]MCG6357195.1 DUF2913 family protein [Vibrio fluvialis]
MKHDSDYYSQLAALVCHALLHLFMEVSATPRFVPVSKRNDILVRYLKHKLNARHGHQFKKDIKAMIQLGRRANGNLEAKLLWLHDSMTMAKTTDMAKLHALLVYLNEYVGVESEVFLEGQEASPDLLYMLEEQIQHGFNDHKQQVAPLSMLIQSDQAHRLESVVNEHGGFIAETKEWNADTQQLHLLLHPLRG